MPIPPFGASYTAINASGLIGDAEHILDLMSDIVLHPAFAADELAQYKQREEAALEQRLSNPGFLAQQAMRRVLYGEAPLSVASPTKESIDKVSAEDLKKFHDQHYRPGNTLLGVIGDFRAEDMRALVAKHFGAWTGACRAASRTAQDGGFAAGKDHARGSSRFGANLHPRRRPDDTANRSRLLCAGGDEPGPRRRALSRGSSSIFARSTAIPTVRTAASARRSIPAIGLANAAVRTPVTDGSMERFTYQFKRIREEPVPPNELDDARRAIVAGFALSLERPAELLNNVLQVQHFGLPADYWDKYPDRIAAVDAAQVQAAAKKYVDLDHMQWVAVGDRKQIRDALAKYGTVTIVNAEGKLQN